MARKALKAASAGPTGPLSEDSINQGFQAMRDMLVGTPGSGSEGHIAEIQQAIEESDDRQIAVNFVWDINCKESSPVVDIKMRFTPCTVTDKRTIQCDDPNQTTLSIFTPQELAAKEALLPKRGPGRPKKVKTTDDVPEGAGAEEEPAHVEVGHSEE